MSLDQARAAIGIFEDLVRALKLAWDEGKGIWTKAKIGPIISALRTVYFPASGSLSILERIARGEKVPTADVKAQLATYNRDEPVVSDALTRLSYDVNSQLRPLSVRSISDLDAVAQGKLSIRRNVREILESLAKGSRVDVADVAKTVAKIRELNAIVDQLDAQLNK